MYYVYILKSNKGNRFYTGVTTNIVKRLINHNKGGTKSTKPFRPWTVAYKEEYDNKYQAFKREFYLKSPKGYLEKRKIISGLI